MPGTPVSVNYVVRYDDVDFTNKAFLPSIFNYFTDLATYHASSVGVSLDELLEKHRAWVLCQWDVDIKRLPLYSEKLTITTIPFSFNKFFAYRKFLVNDESGNTIIEGKSSWMYIDRDRRRPVRLTFDDIKCFGLHEDDEEIIHVEKPTKCNCFSDECVFNITYSDIDTNNHVNNTKYIKWALETLSMDFLASHTVENIKILYAKEVQYGEKIISKMCNSSDEDNIKTLHAICSSSGSHLCDIEIIWKKGH